MSEQPKRFPIEEVICEVNFVPSEEWDITNFGKFYSRIEKEYKDKEQQSIIRPSEDFEEEDTDEPCEPEILMKFNKNDGTRIIQLAEDTLFFNILEYPRWERLKPEIMGCINNYCEICNPKSIESLGLRYINKFELPENEYNISKIFGKSKYLPEIFFEGRFPFFMHQEFPERDCSAVRLNVGNVRPKKEDHLALVFDLEVTSIEPMEISGAIIEGNLNEYHDCINRIFKKCISAEKRRELGIDWGEE